MKKNNSLHINSIIIIIPYFGTWPIWFSAWLKSVEFNPSVHWLCPTDCDLPKTHPKNITFLSTSLTLLNEKVNKVVGVPVPLNPRKFCDLKPAYGDIFKEEIKSYDFWGFCDMDVIFGNIRKFITPEILLNYDIISSRKEAISGHFNLLRNTKELRQLYKKVDRYEYLFQQPKFMWFDEHVLTTHLKSQQHPFKIKWDIILCNQERGIDSHQEYHINKWKWNNGSVFKLKKGKIEDEVMYLHFINWKRTMRKVTIIDKNTKSFYISYHAIHSQPISKIICGLNIFKNLFLGYQKIYRIYNFKKRVKSIFRKIKLSVSN